MTHRPVEQTDVVAESFTVNCSKRGGDAPEMQDPCGYAEKIAREVLKNIPDA